MFCFDTENISQVLCNRCFLWVNMAIAVHQMCEVQFVKYNEPVTLNCSLDNEIFIDKTFILCCEQVTSAL